MERRRVVVTGISAITPLGLDAESSWEGVLAGKSGIDRITLFDTTGFDTHIAGEVKGFKPEEIIAAKACRRMDRFVQLAVCSADQLVKNAGYKIDDTNAENIGVILGVGLGGMQTLEVFYGKLASSGPSRISPFYLPMLIANMAPGQVAIHTGAKGPNMVVTSACASSLHAIGQAYTSVMLGRCEAIMSGGVEAGVTAMGVSGFTSMKALCTCFDDEPQRASRPFDRDRAGFVMGEGCGMLMVESLESAKARGAKIYAEIVGCGSSDDAYHIVAPLESGDGAAAAMRRALKDAGLAPEQISHISAHGTSTHAGDIGETRAIKQVFGKHAEDIAIYASKSQIGHLLGAAGSASSLFAVKTLESGIIPGTINLEHPDPECDLNYMADGPKKLDPEYAMVNAFGFGGTNASVIFKRFVD